MQGSYQEQVCVEVDGTFGELVQSIRTSVDGVSAEQMEKAELLVGLTQLQNDIYHTDDLCHHHIYPTDQNSIIEVRRISAPDKMITFVKNNLVVEIDKVALPRYVETFPRKGTYINKLLKLMKTKLFDFKCSDDGNVVTITSIVNVQFRKRTKVSQCPNNYKDEDFEFM